FPEELTRSADHFINADLIHATRIERTGERFGVIDIHTRAAFGLVVNRACSFPHESVEFWGLRSINGENGYSDGCRDMGRSAVIRDDQACTFEKGAQLGYAEQSRQVFAARGNSGPINDALYVAAFRIRADERKRGRNTPLTKSPHCFRKRFTSPPAFWKRGACIDVKNNFPAAVAREYRGNDVPILVQNSGGRNLRQRSAWRQNKGLFRKSARDVRILGQQYGVGQQLFTPPHRQFKTNPARSTAPGGHKGRVL